MTNIVIGLGEIGRPLLTLLEGSSDPAVGIDVEPVDVSGSVEVMHVCYPFEIPDFISITTAYAERYAPDLIILHSTVEPGTTRSLEAACDRPCVFSPVRGKHTRMVEELQRYHKFVAGTDASAVSRAAAHLEACGIPTATMDQPESLELAKLLETSYFGLLIAWAQEMDRFAKQAGGNYMDIARFFSEIDYLPERVFVPGFIGGHCVIPNIGILQRQFDSPILEAIQRSNARKAEEVGEEATKRRDRIEPVAVPVKS